MHSTKLVLASSEFGWIEFEDSGWVRCCVLEDSVVFSCSLFLVWHTKFSEENLHGDWNLWVILKYRALKEAQSQIQFCKRGPAAKSKNKVIKILTFLYFEIKWLKIYQVFKNVHINWNKWKYWTYWWGQSRQSYLWGEKTLSETGWMCGHRVVFTSFFF